MYRTTYSLTDHIGYRRKIDQDNFLCDGIYKTDDGPDPNFPLAGSVLVGPPVLFGVFDGLGGEACGEIASLLAAQEAASATISRRTPTQSLLDLCQKANTAICRYARDHDIVAMGTTAAMLAFTRKQIVLCDIGDSKIFRLADGALEQLSEDHIILVDAGRKPLLTQDLGTPPEELCIEPYVKVLPYREGDLFLLCTDGLTDMVSLEEIRSILLSVPFGSAAQALQARALENGGRDNVTILLCRPERVRWKDRLFARSSETGNKGGYEDA